ncbi:MAG: rhomboid family intramembrane serine protease [Elainella sp. Prado103]|nr:rhomboid family intramembrane serine protease [Elainella sp. Prado103]
MLTSSLVDPRAIGDWRPRLTLLQEILAVIWAVNILNWAILGRAMDWLAIRPRTQVGLLGIVFAPLLHGDPTHLFGNSLGFVVFGWMVLLYGEPVFWLVSGIVTLSSGLGVWLFGRGRVYALTERQLYPIELVHLGGSGVIFGYLGFLLFISFFDRNPLSLILSLTVGGFYWNLLPGILPKQLGISWEAHLFGFVGGILAARLLPSIALNA